MSYERVGGTLMTNKENNFPKRRFKNFELSGPWEARFLGELGKINPKGQLPQTFEYVDLESVVGTEMVSHRKVTRDTAPSRAQRLAQSGDLFYQTVRPYQKNNFLATNLNGDYVFSTGYAQLRPIISGYFLLSLVQNDSFVKSVLSRCTGTSYPSISADELSKIQVLVSNDEQELYAIGKLFQKLDRLIILHQHKLDKLKNLKKAYLSEMFPAEGKRVPKRRFPGFEGEWEQKKLGEMSNITAGGDVDKDKLLTKGNYPVLANAHTNEGIIGYYEENYQIEAPAVTVTGRGDIGFAKARKENFTPVVRLLSIKSKHNVDFLAEAINQNKVIFESTGVPQLTIPKLSNYKIYFPSEVDEENSIGNFLVSLDSLITLQQQKLDKLNDLKKAYLNELFV